MSDRALDQLIKEPWRFEFSQAMRVLMRNSQHGSTGDFPDRRFDVEREPARVGAQATMGFPASDIHALEEIPNTEFRKMVITFLGLTGPSGVLPHPYTEFVIEREMENDHSPAAFFDIFNHRMAMLFYYAWERYRSPVVYERRPDHDLFRRILLSFVGLGTEHITDGLKRDPETKKPHLPDGFFANYAHLLAIQPRSASTLETILRDYFGVPVEVVQFVGTWYQLDDESTTRFRGERSESERMGHGVVVSEEYWSQESMVRLRIGPLRLASFRRFLRGGPDFVRLGEICRFFAREEMVFEAQLILDRSEVPDTSLEDDGGSQLGWTTWAKTEPFTKHAEDVIIRL